MNHIHLEMNYRKSTKNTHVYENEGSVIPVLYIRKEGTPKDPPPAISIAIEFKK